MKDNAGRGGSAGTIDEDVVHRVLDRAAQAWGDEPLVTFTEDGQATTHSYAELASWSRGVAAALLDGPAQPGDRVAIMVSNRVEFLIAWFGCAYAGLVSVPVNTAMRGQLLAHVLTSTQPAVIVVEADFAEALMLALSTVGAEPTLVVVGGTTAVSNACLAFEDLLGHEEVQMPEVTPGVAHAVFFTSGTTGPAKGVTYSHARTVQLARNSNQWLDMRREDTAHTCLPLFHINALLNTFLNSVRVGCHCVIARRFSARRYWDEVREAGATIVNCLGTMGAILWKSPPSARDRDHRVRRGLVMPCPVDWDEWEQRFGFEVLQCYGSTDAGSIMGIPPDVHRRKGAAGRVLDGWNVAIVDDADTPVPRGRPGELVVRPTRPHIAMSGYWGNPEATVKAWRNLWMHTGDILREDEDGWFWFVSRKDEFIRRAGENVSCFEVENVILRMPRVDLVVAFAVPAEMGDEDVAVVVVPSPGSELGPQELHDFCVENLPKYCVPRYIALSDRLALTESGKVDRAAAIRDYRERLVDVSIRA
jgi:crotonobetaine/carnitine-CoA ligase